jgi:DNA-binding HxlR family transcriptional regulator
VTSRSYAQDCAVALALDAVGDRWTLLVVRELLAGPKRYTDLQDGLPGISTDVLAARLRQLEAGGLVERSVLPAPAASKVYALTERGAALEPVLVALARWGAARFPDGEGREFRPHWFALPLRAFFRPHATRERVVVDFAVGEHRIRALLEQGELTVDGEIPGPADVVVRGDVASLAELVAHPARRADALASGRVTVDGDARSVDAVRQAFGGGP